MLSNLRPLALALLVSPFSQLLGQGSLGGRAVSAHSGAPLYCLDVTLRDTTGRAVKSTKSRVDGSYSFPLLRSDSYTLEFRGPRGDLLLSVKDSVGPRSGSVRTDTLPLILGVADFSVSDPNDVVPPRQRSSPLQARAVWDERGAPLTGEVLLSYVVGIDGRIVDASITVERSSHAALTKAALATLFRKRFYPATREGVPVCLTVQAPFIF